MLSLVWAYIKKKQIARAKIFLVLNSPPKYSWFHPDVSRRPDMHHEHSVRELESVEPSLQRHPVPALARTLSQLTGEGWSLLGRKRSDREMYWNEDSELEAQEVLLLCFWRCKQIFLTEGCIKLNRIQYNNNAISEKNQFKIKQQYWRGHSMAF